MSYGVLACQRCGFVFASGIDSKEDSEAYYRDNLKYTYEGSQHCAPDLVGIHEDSFRFVHETLQARPGPPAAPDNRILDIGCSTGDLLACFRRAGYPRLTGLDPTPACREIARKLYGLEIETGTISTYTADSPFDVVLLSSVLEHLPDLAFAMQKLRALLRNDGFLFVQVPDVDNFGVDMKEPFLEFSIEHINYFTETSLRNLLSRFGFAPVRIRHDVLRYNRTAYPALTSMWSKGEVPEDWEPEPASVAPLRAYVNRSGREIEEVREKIDRLVGSQEEVVVWGVGSLTARLLATTGLKNANIVRFVDSNPGLHGRRLLGKEIQSPDSLRGDGTTVFISTYVYGEEIRSRLLGELRYQGRAVTL